MIVPRLEKRVVTLTTDRASLSLLRLKVAYGITMFIKIDSYI